VNMAVPPNLVEFAESAGLFSVDSYGPDSQQQLEAEVFHDWFKLRNPIKVLRQAREYLTEGWAKMSETLTKLAVGADLILSGTTYHEVAANVAEARRRRDHCRQRALRRPNSCTLGGRRPAGVGYTDQTPGSAPRVVSPP
jgi:hypothetical protein